MGSYRELDLQEYSNGEYSIVPIRFEDRFAIMKWRNEQIYHLRQNEPLTEQSQEHYFTTTIADLFENEAPSQVLFSYLKNGECIGYGGLVHINRLDKNAEISFIMNTELEQEYFDHNWAVFLSLLEEVAFGGLELHKIFTYAFDIRPHLYQVFEKAGFVKEATLKDHCLIDGEYKNVIIHSKYGY